MPAPEGTVAAQSFLLLQRLLPKHLLTALVRRLANVRYAPVKDFLIRTFIRAYDVNVDEIAAPVPQGFADFNAFFTRALADGAREVDASPGSVVSPVDGITSAAGGIDRGRLLQAKGRQYLLRDLLATDLADAELFENGEFATFYLAPYHYHRVHSPLAAEVTAARYVPGSLYSVNDWTVRSLPRLFARNERLICHFRTAAGPMIVILVGALNVGSITTGWTGTVRPRKTGVVEDLRLDPEVPASVEKGGLLGWFNMGSTVIVLLPPDTCTWRDDLVPGKQVWMGEPIGRLRKP
ncbi:MAG TPA: archaetidylserine decarboxylase [Woeseiaceae bacterium]|nr:archaetidylserine decarboxylase [Woeseiaceae bacterium]